MTNPQTPRFQYRPETRSAISRLYNLYADSVDIDRPGVDQMFWDKLKACMDQSSQQVGREGIKSGLAERNGVEALESWIAQILQPAPAPAPAPADSLLPISLQSLPSKWVVKERASLPLRTYTAPDVEGKGKQQEYELHENYRTPAKDRRFLKKNGFSYEMLPEHIKKIAEDRKEVEYFKKLAEAETTRLRYAGDFLKPVDLRGTNLYAMDRGQLYHVRPLPRALTSKPITFETPRDALTADLNNIVLNACTSEEIKAQFSANDAKDLNDAILDETLKILSYPTAISNETAASSTLMDDRYDGLYDDDDDGDAGGVALDPAPAVTRQSLAISSSCSLPLQEAKRPVDAFQLA